MITVKPATEPPVFVYPKAVKPAPIDAVIYNMVYGEPESQQADKNILISAPGKY
jgi:hypothetical protein